MYYYNQPLLRSPTLPNQSLENQKSTIKVSGKGTVYAPPDLAMVTIGVITENKLLTEAQKENAIITSKVISSLLKLGLSKEDIKTVNFSIDMQYDYQDGKQVFRGYKVTHLLQITVRQIQKTGQLVDTAVANGANLVSNIQFILADPEPFYNDALALALKNTQEKAKKIATNLGLKSNSIPVKVTETTQVNIPPIPYQTAYTLKSETTPIQPGELQVTARVDAEFVLFPL